MTAAIAIAEAPKPSNDIDTQIKHAIEARPKLEAAIAEQKQKVAEIKTDFARTLASDIQSAARLDVESAFQKNKAFEDLEERTRQRLAALEGIEEKVEEYLGQLKADSPDAVREALTRRVETLKNAASETERAAKDYAEEIKKLQAEIRGLPKGPAKKAEGS